MDAVQTLQKTVEAPQNLYHDQVVHELVVVQRQMSMVEMVIVSDSLLRHRTMLLMKDVLGDEAETVIVSDSFVTAPGVLNMSACSSSELVFGSHAS